MWTLRASRHHTLLAIDPHWQLEDNITLYKSLHNQVGIQFIAIQDGPPCQKIGHPIFYFLSSRLVMSPEPVLGELILMYWLHLVVVEIKGVLLWVGRYHPVLGFPPLDRLVEASKQPILLQFRLLGEKIPTLLRLLWLVKVPKEAGSWPDYHLNT